MTTNVKITTNGNYVAELKNADGVVLGSAGPGQNVESGSIYVPHNETVTISERPATEDEIAAITGSATADDNAAAAVEGDKAVDDGADAE